MSTPEITLAVARDVQAIAELSRDAIEHGLAWRWTPRRVLKHLQDRATNVIVARQAGRVLGFGIMRYDDDEAHLLLLAVRAGHRRRGVGTRLLTWLETTAQVAGIGVIRLEARAGNASARGFYRRHGYVETGRVAGYYEGVEDAVRIAKDMSADANALQDKPAPGPH